MATGTSTARDKRELVDRVAASLIFQKSPRLRGFLLYVADCTINNRLEGAREQQIAVNVFNRRPDYNPGQDNIVRVEARSLRKRLETYFATEGRDEPIVISMPKGSYSLSFEARQNGCKPDVPVEIAYPSTKSATPPKTYSRLIIIFSVFLAALTILMVMQWQSKQSGSVSHPGPAAILPFSALIEPGKETYIVTSDCALVLIEDLRRQQVNLDDYITGRYMADTSLSAPDKPTQDLIRILLKRRYTNSAETAVAGRIIQRYSPYSQRILLRAGHGVQLSDFKNHNVILFGSPTSNPWARLFSEKLNFQFDWDQVRRGRYRNRSPRSGEQAVYSMTTNPGDSGKAYAVVALVPNVNGNGNVLLVGGTTAEGTEAAGEFITDDARTSGALKSIGIDPAGPTRYFEFLLEVKAIAGSGSQSKLLASRLISDGQVNSAAAN